MMMRRCGCSSSRRVFSSLAGQTFMIPTIAIRRNETVETLASRLQVLPGLQIKSSPIVLDVSAVAHDGTPHCNVPTPLEFQHFIKTVRKCGFIPVGVVNGCSELKRISQRLSLPSLLSSNATSDFKIDLERLATPVVVPDVNEDSSTTTTVIERSVRTGEQIYANNGASLVILGSVNSGAEVLADKDITILGTLRGRALAGVTGNATARVYAANFDAELVAIASVFTTCDELQHERGQPTHVQLRDNILKFSSPVTNIIAPKVVGNSNTLS